MSTINEEAVQIELQALGYEELSAKKVVSDVHEAMRLARQGYLQKYKNKVGSTDIGGLIIDVFVHDVKVTYQGTEFQVKPVAGNGALWVKNFTLKD